MGERMPTDAEAEVLAFIADEEPDESRVTDPAIVSAMRFNEWAVWAPYRDGLVVRHQVLITHAGRAALARYRAQKGDGADA